MKIAIIGAGLAGLATCYHLLSSEKIGVEVHVFDKCGIGKGASGMAAGLLHPYRRDFDRYIWNGKEALQETSKLIKVAESEENTVILQQGILKIATNPEEVTLLSSLKHEDTEWWNEKKVSESYKYLKNFSGLFVKSGISISPVRYLQGLWRALEKKGAKLYIEEIKNLSSLDEYDHVVVAAGAKIFQFSEAADLKINVVKGQILILNSQGLDHLPHALNGGCYVAQHELNSLIIGATYEHNFKDLEPDQRQSENELFPKLEKLSPILRSLPVKDCLSEGRVSTKNHLPLIERKNERLWFFTGLGSRGFLYHAFLGKRLAHDILGIWETPEKLSMS